MSVLHPEFYLGLIQQKQSFVIAYRFGLCPLTYLVGFTDSVKIDKWSEKITAKRH